MFIVLWIIVDYSGCQVDQSVTSKSGGPAETIKISLELCDGFLVV